VLGRALLFLASSAVVLMAVSPWAPKLPGMWPQFLVGLWASLGTLALTWVFVRWDGLRLRDVGAAPTRRSVPRLAFGVALGFVLLAGQWLSLAATGHIRWVRAPEHGIAAAAVAMLAYAALACREELGFRGYPLRRLETGFGLWGAQLIVAAVFALEHVAGGYSWLNASLGVFAGALLFGMAALATRGLAVPIGLHAAWNFGQWMMGQKESAGLWRAVVDPGFEAHLERVGMASYLIVVGMAFGGFWWWYRQERAKGNLSLRAAP